MDERAPSAEPLHPPDTVLALRETQRDSILLVLLGMYVVALALFAYGGSVDEPARGFLPGVLLMLLLGLVWALRSAHYGLSAWTLVIGCLGIDLLVAFWSPLPVAIMLVAWPVSLAALFLGARSGAGVAAGCTLVIVLAPARLFPADPTLRGLAMLSAWGAEALIWLTVRPLWTTVQWSFSSYQESRRLLDQMRNSRLQLKEALADLADRNEQLARINRLVQALRQEAEEARSAKEQFVANVSHELRTPLNMIVGFSEMILRVPETYGRRLPAALLADLGVVLRNAQHLSHLIDDVLDLSQIQAGRMALTRERVALGELVEGATTAIRPLFDSKGLSLLAEVAPDLPPLWCDPTRIRQVVLNLLSNAGRFTEQGGVQVRAWREGDECALSVADTGPGIARQNLGRLFQPFEQLDASLRKHHGGSGLGLSISKGFVELHGGRMWVESEPGAGSTFHIRLPIDPPLAAEPRPQRWLNPAWEYREHRRDAQGRGSAVRTRFVLLDPAQALGPLLRRHFDDAEVAPVDDLPAALAELEREPAEALLVNGPSLGQALERLDRAHALPPGIPAIACSLPGPGDAAGALGVSGYLVKPVQREALLAALERLQLAGNKVLVVDDDDEVQQLFLRMLALPDRRYRVLRAGNGREGLEVLREERPDVVLLDMVMPEADGNYFLAAKGQDPALVGIPVLVTSARDPAGQAAVSHGIAAVRQEGLTVPQVLASLEALTHILGAASRE